MWWCLQRGLGTAVMPPHHPPTTRRRSSLHISSPPTTPQDRETALPVRAGTKLHLEGEEEGNVLLSRGFTSISQTHRRVLSEVWLFGEVGHRV